MKDAVPDSPGRAKLGHELDGKKDRSDPPLTIRIINLTSPESVSSPYASWIRILPFMEIRFPRRRKKEARHAITPSPPIWIRISTTICPNSVYCSAGITVTSPVTQTEVTEVNSASINSIGFWLHTGSQRRKPENNSS